MGIINNTNSYIPYEYIKDIYFTDVKNKDGSLVHFNRNKLFVYDNIKNGVVFNACDKPQKVRSFLALELISGTILKTAHDREVIVD